MVKLIRYIINPEKTSDEQCLYVDSFNCSVVHTASEFKAVREKWQKTTGNYAYHFEQSFKPGEVSAEECHQCGAELAEALFAQFGYQVIFSTHLDKDHLHNHFAVNAVNPIDGKKLQTDHAFIRTMRQQNDRICKAHNLSVVNEPKGKGKSYAEWITEKKGGFTWRGVVRSDIDDLLPSVRSLKELLDELSKQGYQIHTKKYISVSPPGTKSFFRLHKLGAGYSEEELVSRILNEPQLKDFKSHDAIYPIRVKTVRIRYIGVFSHMKKRGGFRSLYLYYLFRLRRLTDSKPLQKRMPVQVRKDVKCASEFAQDLRTLQDNRIDTMQQLTDFYFSQCNLLEQLDEKKTLFRERLLRCEDQEALRTIHSSLSEINRQIQTIKQSIKSSERIYERSDRMRDSIREINQIMHQKGMIHDVSRSRSNRRSGEDLTSRG